MPQHLVRLVQNNYSSRHGEDPQIIVLHTTEGHDRPGVSDLLGLADYFNRPNVQASSHVANDREGNTIRMVHDADKAWTQSHYNPVSLSIEQIGFARFGRVEWMTLRRRQLHATARQIAKWSVRHHIPIRFSTIHGVCQHSDLGPRGGGHHDCGPGYPFDYVLKLARNYATGEAPTPRQKLERSLRILRAKARRSGWKKPWRVAARKIKKQLGK